MKIPKWQPKLVRNCKQGKLVSYFINNAAKTCLHGLKISENIEIEHVFQSKAFFISSAISTQVASAPLTLKENIVAVITQNRVIDDILKRQIKNETFYTFRLFLLI